VSGVLLLEFNAQPRSGIRPPGIRRARRDAENLGALGEGQAAKIPDQFGQLRLFLGQARECFVEGFDANTLASRYMRRGVSPHAMGRMIAPKEILLRYDDFHITLTAQDGDADVVRMAFQDQIDQRRTDHQLADFDPVQKLRQNRSVETNPTLHCVER
jgi:hypothetical protein